jgi:hypothetical protein
MSNRINQLTIFKRNVQDSNISNISREINNKLLKQIELKSKIFYHNKAVAEAKAQALAQEQALAQAQADKIVNKSNKNKVNIHKSAIVNNNVHLI